MKFKMVFHPKSFTVALVHTQQGGLVPCPRTLPHIKRGEDKSANLFELKNFGDI